MFNIKKQLRYGDIKYIQELSQKLGLNKGKGYTYTYIKMIVDGKRKNSMITKLFIDLIEQRKKLEDKM